MIRSNVVTVGIMQNGRKETHESLECTESEKRIVVRTASKIDVHLHTDAKQDKMF